MTIPLVNEIANFEIEGTVVFDNCEALTKQDLVGFGEDFDCGDEIVFTFTGSILDLNVSTAAR